MSQRCPAQRVLGKSGQFRSGDLPDVAVSKSSHKGHIKSSNEQWGSHLSHCRLERYLINQADSSQSNPWAPHPGHERPWNSKKDRQCCQSIQDHRAPMPGLRIRRLA